MASKLELRFTNVGEIASLTIATDIIYNFKFDRLGYREVTIGKEVLLSPADVAKNFHDAFQVDDNYANAYKVSFLTTLQNADGSAISGDPHGIVIIEHPDNTFFDGHSNTTSFITSTITTTTQEVDQTLTVSLAEAVNACGDYKLVINTNKTTGTLYIESPIGISQGQITLDGSASYELELTRPSTAQSGVVKFLADDRSSRGSNEAYFTAPGVLSVTSVSLEGTPFGAMATINTNGGNNKTYSLDNTNYQSSNEFAGLLAGNYTAYVQDDLGCTKTKTFVVTEDMVSGLTAPPFIRVPIHNSIRFADRTGVNFLNYLSTETPGYININQYYQDYLVNDTIRTQFKSSYATNKVFLIDEQGTETEISVLQKSNNINRINIYEGNYKDKDGRLAVYFTSGNIYNEDGTAKEQGHILNGRLPMWYEEGLYLNIEGLGVAKIDRILLDPDGTTYAITTLDAAGVATGKKITSIHTEHPYEVYEFEVNFQNTGKYQLRLEYWNEEKNFYLTELIKVHSELEPEYLEVQWWNKNNNDIIYNTGIRHFRRLKWESYFTLMPKTEKETYDTDTTVELINSKSFAVYKLSFESMPMEVARGLQVAFDNSSTIVINGVKFVSETPVKLEPGGQWYDFEAELTLVDQTMNGQQEIVDVINAEFLNVGTESDVSFLRLN